MSESVKQKPQWMLAVEAFRAEGKTYGDSITHSWVYKALGIKEPKDDIAFARGKELMLARLKPFRKFRKMLLVEDKIFLFMAPGHGYRIVKPSEQARTAHKHYMGRIRRLFNDMMRAIINVNASELTPEERVRDRDLAAKAAWHQDMMNKRRISE